MCVCVPHFVQTTWWSPPYFLTISRLTVSRSSPGRAKGKAKAKAKAADPVVQEEEEEVLGLSRGGLKSRD